MSTTAFNCTINYPVKWGKILLWLPEIHSKNTLTIFQVLKDDILILRIIRNTILILCLTPLHFQNWLNSTVHGIDLIRC